MKPQSLNYAVRDTLWPWISSLAFALQAVVRARRMLNEFPNSPVATASLSEAKQEYIPLRRAWLCARARDRFTRDDTREFDALLKAVIKGDFESVFLVI